jgi:hypothetical protein
MSGKSILLIGNPDSGKSNFLAKLWLALQSKKFSVVATNRPNDIKYVEEIAAHLLHGEFVPRTEKEETNRSFDISVNTSDGSTNATIHIPDLSGEIWRSAVETFEIPKKWHNNMRSSSAAMLFVRVHSDLNVQPLDLVTSRELIDSGLAENQENMHIPTQVSLIELLRFLESTLRQESMSKPKVAVIVTAWDLMNADDAKQGPLGYLKREFPMFAGRLEDSNVCEVRIFGSSVSGGDFRVPEFLDEYRRNDPKTAGFIITEDQAGTTRRINDLTIPLSWLLER